MGWLAQYGEWLEVGSLFFALAAGSYYLASGVLWLVSLGLQRGRGRCRADLFWRDRKVTLTALVDTGNSLKDPFTGSPSASWRGRRRRSCFRAGCRRSCGISRTAQLEGRMECFRL